MELHNFKTGMLLLIFAAGLATSSCKGKEKNNENTNTATSVDTSSATTMDTSTAATIAPATSMDDSLRTQLKDATKDYPDVTATVENGEVTLTGTITKEKLPKLMQAVHALNPRKVNNNLTIKK
ncbi:MAG TPA: BON domain-containing protein [Chitinophagaceae bacterium]|jgi:osmotically-inducible protein OsmY